MTANFKFSKLRPSGLPFHMVACIAASVFLSISQPAEAKCSGEKTIVAVDVGHTPKRGGATSARGRSEYTFNYRFAKEFIQRYGRSGKLSFIMLNPSGQNIGLRHRVRQADRLRADLFVSFHHDSVHEQFHSTWVHGGKKRAQSSYASGYSLFVSSGNPKYMQSLKLARSIGSAMRSAGFQRSLHHAEDVEKERRKILDRGLGVFDAPFVVLRNNRIPAVLVELGVIINPDEEAALNKRAYRKRLGAAIARGIRNFCK